MKYDINLIKAYFLLILFIEPEVESVAIKKANQLVSIKFKKFQFFQFLNFLSGATNVDFFSKIYRTKETKMSLAYFFFNHPDKLNIT